MVNSLLITDMSGNVLYEEPSLSYPAEFYNVTTILAATHDLEAALWNLETGKVARLGFLSHHELEANFENNTIFALESYFVMSRGIPFMYDAVLEYDLNGSIVWQLNTSDFIEKHYWCPYHDYEGGGIPDITHANSILYDSEKDAIYLNTRNLNTFYKIDHKTGEVIWALGEHGDFDLYDLDGELRTNLFYHPHAIELANENTFIMFDNDYHNQTNPASTNSRILEIVIDEERMIANVSWVWTGPHEYYSTVWGDADRLPNGNRLGTFGTSRKLDSDYGAILVEVNEDGDIVWEMKIVNENDVIHGVYRMERFRSTPSISSLDDIEISGIDNILNWQTWYNYRTKHDVTTHYEILVDEVLVASEPLVYNRYWCPANITYNAGVLDAGVHNLTILVYDEVGNFASDSIQITVAAPILSTTVLVIGGFLVCCIVGISVVLYKRFIPS